MRGKECLRKMMINWQKQLKEQGMMKKMMNDFIWKMFVWSSVVAGIIVAVQIIRMVF